MTITMPITLAIGSAEEARIAIEGYEPKGWQYLGSGSYRSAYLSPTGVVYKVNDDDSYYGSNDSEWDNYLRIEGMVLPSWLRIPRMQLYGDVMAAEYVDMSNALEWCTFDECLCGGIWRGMCQVYLHDEVNELLNISDMHNDNLIPVPSPMGMQWWAIDLGH